MTDRTLAGNLIVVTNKNTILHYIFATGEYHRYDIQKISC
jgi:hypothetical protein